MDDINLDRKKLQLTDGNIILRPYRNSDIKEQFKAIRASLNEMGPWLPFAHPDYSIEDTQKWIKASPANWKAGTQYTFCILDAKDSSIIGGCGISDFGEGRSRCNLGYWVRSDRTGQGIAVAATRLLAKWGFEVLKLKRIEIVVAVENARSLRVAEKAGAKREGILRNRLDIRHVVHDAVMHSLVPGEV